MPVSDTALLSSNSSAPVPGSASATGPTPSSGPTTTTDTSTAPGCSAAIGLTTATGYSTATAPAPVLTASVSVSDPISLQSTSTSHVDSQGDIVEFDHSTSLTNLAVELENLRKSNFLTDLNISECMSSLDGASRNPDNPLKQG